MLPIYTFHKSRQEIFNIIKFLLCCYPLEPNVEWVENIWHRKINIEEQDQKTIGLVLGKRNETDTYEYVTRTSENKWLLSTSENNLSARILNIYLNTQFRVVAKLTKK